MGGDFEDIASMIRGLGRGSVEVNVLSRSGAEWPTARRVAATINKGKQAHLFQSRFRKDVKLAVNGI
jgi:hypothetical protein